MDAHSQYIGWQTAHKTPVYTSVVGRGSEKDHILYVATPNVCACVASSVLAQSYWIAFPTPTTGSFSQIERQHRPIYNIIFFCLFDMLHKFYSIQPSFIRKCIAFSRQMFKQLLNKLFGILMLAFDV